MGTFLMIEVKGDIWEYKREWEWIVVTTNGDVKKNGRAVMGRGVALEATVFLLGLPEELGERIKKYGSRVFAFIGWGILTFPVKKHWNEKANLGLIRASAIELESIVTTLGLSEVYMVRPGCGNGGLGWKEVKDTICDILDDRFVVVQK